jgi:FixJ family two-component response regulator
MDIVRRLVAVVDDDVDVLTAFGRVLRARGFEAALYGSAEAYLAAPPTATPVCLVVDVKLGGMTGLELQRRLRDQGSTIPVVVMTTCDDPRTRDEARRLGCVGFFDKQADIDEFLTLVRRL